MSTSQSMTSGAGRSSARHQRAARRWRGSLWGLALMLTLAMLLPGVSLLVGLAGPAGAQPAAETTNPRANFYRAVRAGEPGYTAVRGAETGVLIQNGGQNWRQLRNGPLALYGAWAMLVMVILLAMFFAVRGRVRLDGPRTGRLLARWSVVDRFVHWYTAVLFVIMAITGLSMLFGRAVLIPVFGKAANAAWAQIALTLHNTLGPALAIGVVLMIGLWMRHNLPTGTDLRWFLKGGGMLGRSHPDAGFANGGEKVWFWIVAIVGGVGVIVTGLMLDFQPSLPFLTRELAQDYHIVHVTAAFIWICVWLGHAYIGTLGSEGSFEAMWTGHVDETWARQHHNLWYEEVLVEAEEDARDADAQTQTSARATPATTGSS
ncbi:MAG: formate dehydrogenase subunit gamma [Gammaproteobacteria bacterium]|nr:formate dehydrogenase subunit gamma [Gammaproteobacteria bacterium]